MSHEHHAPLVVFTSLAVSGAGLVAADAALMATAHAPVSVPAVAVGVACQFVGLAVSLLHLGRRTRAPLAGLRIGRSALSNEILMAGLSLAAGAALLAVALRGPAPTLLRSAAGVTSGGLLLAIGLVYRLRGQLTWTGPVVFTPLSAGCAFGAIVIQSLSAPGGVPRGVVALVGADAAIFLLRWQEAAALDRGGSSPVLVSAWRRRHQWFAARFFLLDVLPFGFILFRPTFLAIGAAACGLIVDRLAFYALAVPHSTDLEVARVDEAIRAASPPHKP